MADQHTEVPCVFVAEDFDELNIWTAEDIAVVANKKLAEIAKGWPVVYLERKLDDPDSWFISDTGGDLTDTHTARLAFVSPIIKEEAPCPTCGHKK